MKKIITLMSVFSLLFAYVIPVSAQEIDAKLKGRILLQVEQNGEAWYVNPENLKRYYMGNPEEAYMLMRDLGVGITNADLEKIPIGDANSSGIDSDGDGLSDALEDSLGTNRYSKDSDNDGYDDKVEILNNYSPVNSGKYNTDFNFVNKQKGRILLQVEQNGEAWYVNPEDGKRYFLGQPDDAYSVMRSSGLGIKDEDLDQIRTFANSYWDLLGDNSSDPIVEQAVANMKKIDKMEYNSSMSLNFYIDPNKIEESYRKQDVIDIDVNYDSESKIDNSQKYSPKNEFNLNLEVDTGSTSYLFDAESKMIDDKFYFRINKIPEIIKQEFDEINDFVGEWTMINPTELEDQSRNMGMIAPSIEVEKINNKINTSLLGGNIISINKVEENQSAYHYKIFLSKDNLRNTIKESFNMYTDEMGLSGDTEEAEQAIDDLINKIQIEGNLWIEKGTNYITKIDFDTSIDFGGIEIEGEIMPENAMKFSCHGNFEFNKINSEISIAAPSNYTSLADYMNKQASKSRDAKRISDIKQIQTALELYYSDRGRYPENITVNGRLEYNDMTYMYRIPSNPKPSDGLCDPNFQYTYTSSNDGQSYELDYCLGNQTGGVAAGYNIASPYGISQ